MKVLLVGPLAALALALFVACGDDPEPTTTTQATMESPTPVVTSEPPTATSTPTATPVPTPTATPTVTAVPSPTTTATATPLHSAVQRVVPSVVRIRIGDSDVGSGFVVEGSYIVTAAHVVWPYTIADVVFENGVEHKDVPVVSSDHLADLAFLGPINTSVPPVEFANVEDERKGDTVFVIGYPENTLGLSVARGEFESIHVWLEADVTEVYSTAESESGTSGGPMVNGNREVIGVNLRSYDDGSSGGTSSNTVRDRLDKIARGEEVSPAGSRPLPENQGSHQHEFVLRGRADTEIFFFRDLSETSISIEFDTPQDVEYGLFDYGGYADFRPAFRSTRSGLRDSCCYSGTWFVVVRQRYDLEREVVIRSSVPLVRYHDPDDGRKLQVGDVVTAVFDTAGDVDRYTIKLLREQRINIRLESVFGAQITIDYPDAAPYEIFSVDGVLEEIEYRAPVEAEYTIAIQPSGERLGYSLSIFDTASNAQKEPDDVIASPVGDVLRYTFEHSDPTIHIDYPLNITGGDHAEILGAALFEQGRRGQTIALEEREMRFLGQASQEELSLDKYMRRSPLVQGLPVFGERVTASREILTPSGASILIEYFEAGEGHTKGVRLAYIHEKETGFMAVFYAPADVFDEWRSVVDYCIGSFSIRDFSVADEL